MVWTGQLFMDQRINCLETWLSEEKCSTHSPSEWFIISLFSSDKSGHSRKITLCVQIWLQHLLLVWVWSRYLIPPGLSCLLCEMGMIIAVGFECEGFGITG